MIAYPDPQPITDDQKNGEPFLVWHENEYQRGWHVAEWSDEVDLWLRGGGEQYYLKPDSVVYYLPLPPEPDIKEK